MTNFITFYGKGSIPDNFEEIKIKPQQIFKPNPLLFLDNVKLSDFPNDYIEFIEYFGEGLLGDYLRIFPMSFIDDLILPWREQTIKHTPINKNNGKLKG